MTVELFRPRRLATRISATIFLVAVLVLTVLETAQVFLVSGPLWSLTHTFRHQVQGVLYDDALAEKEQVAQLVRMFQTQLDEAETLEDLQPFTEIYRRDLLFPTPLAFGLTVILAVLLAAYLSRQITRPVAVVAKAAEQVARGTLTTRAPVTPRLERRNDETTLLIRSFNQMAETLERLEHERQAMVADIAHELRTPLTIIQSHLDGMQDGVIPVNQNELAILSHQSELLARLVSDLRTLSLAEAGRLTLELRPTQLVLFLRDVIRGFEAEAKAKRVQLKLETTETGLWVTVDPDRLEQVLANLLSNALWHSPEGSWVTVGVKNEDAEAILSVTDSGPGLSEEALEHVLERFYRGDAKQGRKEGSGLGLAIVKALVELHGGQVSASNTANGAKFEVRLCLASFAPAEVESRREHSRMYDN